MPTIFIFFGFRFMFYANEHLPIHVHVIKGNAKAKFYVDPVKLEKNQGMKPAELKIIKAIIEDNKEIIIEHWMKFFNDKNEKQ